MKRNCEIKVRLSKQELGNLTRKVNKTNFSREAFVRCVLNDCAIKEAPPAEYYELIRELRKVGSNLNQILKLANTKGLLDVLQLRKDLEQIRETEQMLYDTFYVGE